MSREEIRALGLQRLQTFEASGGAVGRWRTFLAGYRPRADFPDDACAWLTCVLALEGVAGGNYGVGAALVDAGGRVVAWGHNQVFHPHFRSDRHAEMVVLEKWEEGRPAAPWPGGLALHTSLEPCPMCLVRLCCADVRRVLFAAADPAGGMAGRLDSLPPAWRELARGTAFAAARCSPELAEAAAEVFLLNRDELNARLPAR